jgi:hypothetical protein
MTFCERNGQDLSVLLSTGSDWYSFAHAVSLLDPFVVLIFRKALRDYETGNRMMVGGYGAKTQSI